MAINNQINKTHKIPCDLLCPITLEIMVDPVITNDGYTYDRKSILQLTNLISPITREPIKYLIPNRALKNIIDNFCKEDSILEKLDLKSCSLLQERLKNKIKNPNCKICISNKKYNPNTAAQHGHLECLKYAYNEDNSPWNSFTCKYAAENGHLECLKYAHENGCPWDKETSSNAAKNGHLECLKYAHENGCPWDEETTSNASKYGYFECLKYARENGCDIGKTKLKKKCIIC